MDLNTIIEEMKKEDVVICDGLLTGQLGKVIGVGSSEHSIKLLVDGIERYEPDYALLYITNENKKALALLVSHITTTAQRVREETIEEERTRIANALVDALPTGTIDAFEIIKAIKKFQENLLSTLNK